jgi:Cu/Ag efflux protein CusF
MRSFRDYEVRRKFKKDTMMRMFVKDTMMTTFIRSIIVIFFSALAIVSLTPKVQAAELTTGVVRKIDIENSKVTIRHEEIQHLHMPPMTMVFSVKNKTLLEKLQPGQTVKFGVVDEGGKFVITQLQPGDQ